MVYWQRFDTVSTGRGLIQRSAGRGLILWFTGRGLIQCLLVEF